MFDFGYETLEMKIEKHVLSQLNKLLMDPLVPPYNTLIENEVAHFNNSMFKRKFTNAYSGDLLTRTSDYPLSETELADLQYYRLVEIIRKEQIQIFNLAEMSTFDLSDIPPSGGYRVPLLYVCPGMGLTPVDYPNLQHGTEAYFYPINLRLVLNRDETAFPALTMTDTESLIREGIEYVLDRAGLVGMYASRNGYDIDSRVVDNVGIERATLKGFASPWEVFDYELFLVIQKQATLAANPHN